MVLRRGGVKKVRVVMIDKFWSLLKLLLDVH